MVINVKIVEPIFRPSDQELMMVEDRYDVENILRSVNPGRVEIVEFEQDYNKPVQDETKNTVRNQLFELFTKYKKELLDNKNYPMGYWSYLTTGGKYVP